MSRPVRAGVVVVGLIALAACGSDDEGSNDTAALAETDPQNSTGTGTEAEPHNTAESDDVLEATLAATTEGATATLDPHAETGASARPYWMPIFDTLTNVLIAGDVQPRLASEWEFAEDGSALSLTIREGVQFNDGTALDAEAVKTSLDRSRGEESTVAGELSAVTDVVVTGPMEVTLELSRLDRALPAVLGGPAGAIVNPAVVEQGIDLTGGAPGMGTGAYEASSFVPSGRVEFERVQSTNWDPGVGRLAGFSIEPMLDHQVALNGLAAGQLDIVRVTGFGQEIDGMVNSGEFAVTEVPANRSIAFWLNSTDPAFADVRVRQAMHFAIDREAIVNGVFDGGRECAASSQVAPFVGDLLMIEGYDPYPFDADRARQLLEDADAVGTRLQLTTAGAVDVNRATEAAVPMLEAVGFDVEMVIGTLDDYGNWRNGDLQILAGTPGSMPHPSIAVQRYWLGDGPFHLARGEDQGLLETLEASSEPSLSPEGVLEIWDELARALAEDVATNVTICATRTSFVHRADVEGMDTRKLYLDMKTVGVART